MSASNLEIVLYQIDIQLLNNHEQENIDYMSWNRFRDDLGLLFSWTDEDEV